MAWCVWEVCRLRVVLSIALPALAPGSELPAKTGFLHVIMNKCCLPKTQGSQSPLQQDKEARGKAALY